MKKITNRDLQMLYAPAPQSLAEDVRRVLCSLDDETEEKNVKKKLPCRMAHGRDRPHGYAGLSEGARMAGKAEENTPSALY